MKPGKVCGTPLTPIGYFSSGSGGSRKVHPVFAHSSGTRRIRGVSAYPSASKVSMPHVHETGHRVRVVSPKGPASRTKPITAKASISGQRVESDLNAKVFHGLERRYGADKTGTILRQAQESYHYHNPRSETSAETYELFENGNIDEAIESLNFPQWAIGRPKTLHRIQSDLLGRQTEKMLQIHRLPETVERVPLKKGQMETLLNYADASRATTLGRYTVLRVQRPKEVIIVAGRIKKRKARQKLKRSPVLSSSIPLSSQPERMRLPFTIVQDLRTHTRQPGTINITPRQLALPP